MKKLLSVLIVLMLCASYCWCAEPTPEAPKKGPEIDDTKKGEISLADEKFTSTTSNHAMYQVFTLDPDTYSYMYVGFLRDKPNTDPNVIPTSLVSYALMDINQIKAPADKVPENTTFITDPNFPLWLWYRIKTAHTVKLTLSFGKIYRTKSPGSGPCYLPYISIYERDGKTEHSITGADNNTVLCRGGWRPTGLVVPPGPVPKRAAAAEQTYEEIGVSGDTASILIVDETTVKNTSRGDNLMLKILANYKNEKSGDPVDTSQYKMTMTLTVEVKK